jgi:hypothetical protein
VWPAAWVPSSAHGRRAHAQIGCHVTSRSWSSFFFVILSCRYSVVTCFYLVKVKQSHYRPGQALRVPGGWGSPITWQSAHEGSKFVSPTHRQTLPPRKYTWYSFLLEDESTPGPMVRPEGLCHWKIPITPSGIESTTFRLVAQCFNQLRHRVPPIYLASGPKNHRTSYIGTLFYLTTVASHLPSAGLTSETATCNEQMWRVSDSQRKTFAAPYLNMMSKNIVVTALR